MSGLPLTVYELVAMGLRYWLVFLAVVIVWRAVRLMRKDNRLYRKTIRQLPDAGLIGELVELDTGKSFPLPREGMIGSGRSSDIRLEGIKRRALELVFKTGYGLRLIPSHRRHAMRLDGEAIPPAGDYALHGSVLEVGEKAYRFRLFEGLDVPEREPMPPTGANDRTALPQEEEDVWAAHMVMDALPPLPPGAEDYGFPAPDWSGIDPSGRQPERQTYTMPPAPYEPIDPQYWQPQQGEDAQDGY